MKKYRVTGPIGIGKTTMLKFIAGLHKKINGSLYVGQKWYQDNEKNIFIKPQARRFGFVFQEPHFFPNLSIKDNLLFGYKRTPLSKRYLEPKEIIDLFKLEKILSNLSYINLSRGEKQKISLARALIRNPYLLVLDEALSNMDKGTELRICKNLLKNYPYMSKIVVSHRETLDNFADKIIKL